MKLFKKPGVQEIKFIAWNEYAWKNVPKPFPASQAVPDWWKNESPFVKTPDNPEGKKLSIHNRIANYSFKKCTPMLDTLTSGYLVPLWSDVLIDSTPEGPKISWRVLPDVFEMHGTSAWGVERPPGYSKVVFKYMTQWNIATPPGYSVLITSPYGYRKANPFKIIDAVFDGDKSQHEIILPCWIQEGFEGIVERGTPMAQIIPFKRTDWKVAFDYHTQEEHLTIMDRTVRATIWNNYLRNSHSKKSYK
jgi:hypothetical protein